MHLHYCAMTRHHCDNDDDDDDDDDDNEMNINSSC